MCVVLLRYCDAFFRHDQNKYVVTIFSGIIHSDFNNHNILVTPTDSTTSSSSSSERSVCGVLDFGDATKSFLLVEVAIAMCYMTLSCPSDLDPDEMSGHALAGYLSEVRTSDRVSLAVHVCVFNGVWGGGDVGGGVYVCVCVAV